LLKLHLPAALPFIFNALKINSTLALIGAIVAEFFGTPLHGIGFRISIEVARMSLDMVWAEIALAAVAGMAFYGIVALPSGRRPPGIRRIGVDSVALKRGGTTMTKKFVRNGLACGVFARAAPHAADKVTIQLKWVTQAQFAGYYVAAAKGLYKDAGLDVTINPGGPDVAPPQVIAGGGADVVIDWMPSALASREKGVPLVNISQTFKRPAWS
jgi:hypothetical protein